MEAKNMSDRKTNTKLTFCQVYWFFFLCLWCFYVVQHLTKVNPQPINKCTESFTEIK